MNELVKPKNMIYVTWITEQYECSEINRVWLSEHLDLEERYKTYVNGEARKRGIIINEHWLNIMSREDHHTNMTEEEYRKVRKQWNTFLRKNSFDKYIARTGLAEEQEVKRVFL